MRERMWVVVLVLAGILAVGVAVRSGGRDFLMMTGIIVLIVAVVGIVPFLLGLVVQLGMRARPLPTWGLWVGAALLLLPSLVWNQPRLVFLDSRWSGMAIAFFLDAMFIDYGARLVRAMRLRRMNRDAEMSDRAEA